MRPSKKSSAIVVTLAGARSMKSGAVSPGARGGRGAAADTEPGFGTHDTGLPDGVESGIAGTEPGSPSGSDPIAGPATGAGGASGVGAPAERGAGGAGASGAPLSSLSAASYALRAAASNSFACVGPIPPPRPGRSRARSRPVIARQRLGAAGEGPVCPPFSGVSGWLTRRRPRSGGSTDRHVPDCTGSGPPARPFDGADCGACPHEEWTPARMPGLSQPLRLSPGAQGCTVTSRSPRASSSARSWSGVPARSGNVPQWMGATASTPSSSTASAASRGPIV